jgi:putative DNA primase/helicase
MVAPTPAFFGAYALEFDYRSDAAQPDHWLAFMADIWPDDPQSISMLQEWFGYSITADTSYQKMLMMIGPKRSGRGTIARAMQALLGPDNVVTPTLSGLATHFGAACLIGKPAAIFTDARISGRSDATMAVERILSVTGEDPQTIPRKNQEDWKGRLRTKFTLISNELPKLTDVSGALPSRMIVLRFTKSFLGREDRDLERKIKSELPGILVWAIAGWRRLRDRGHFIQPESALDLVEQMENLSSPIGEFAKDLCVVGPTHDVHTKDLYETWREWCQQNGIDHPGSAPLFGRNLTAAFHTVRTSNPTTRGNRKGRWYLGIDISPEEKARRAAAEAQAMRDVF